LPGWPIPAAGLCRHQIDGKLFNVDLEISQGGVPQGTMRKPDQNLLSSGQFGQVRGIGRAENSTFQFEPESEEIESGVFSLKAETRRLLELGFEQAKQPGSPPTGVDESQAGQDQDNCGATDPKQQPPKSPNVDTYSQQAIPSSIRF
jgi:hypothetical protein